MKQQVEPQPEDLAFTPEEDELEPTGEVDLSNVEMIEIQPTTAGLGEASHSFDYPMDRESLIERGPAPHGTDVLANLRRRVCYKLLYCVDRHHQEPTLAIGRRKQPSLQALLRTATPRLVSSWRLCQFVVCTTEL